MGKKDKRTAFENTIFDIRRTMPFFEGVSNTHQLGKTFNDDFITAEQKKRDEQITLLLQHYVDNYNEKRKSNSVYKKIILGICGLIIVTFSIAFMILLFKVNQMSDLQVNNVVALITVSITYLSLIIGLLTIITKYVFPRNEEEYITRIVESIQRNDLKNKKANIGIGTRNESEC